MSHQDYYIVNLLNESRRRDMLHEVEHERLVKLADGEPHRFSIAVRLVSSVLGAVFQALGRVMLWAAGPCPEPAERTESDVAESRATTDYHWERALNEGC